MDTNFIRTTDGSYLVPDEMLYVSRQDQAALRTAGDRAEPTVSALIPSAERKSLFRRNRKPVVAALVVLADRTDDPEIWELAAERL